MVISCFITEGKCFVFLKKSISYSPCVLSLSLLFKDPLLPPVNTQVNSVSSFTSLEFNVRKLAALYTFFPSAFLDSETVLIRSIVLVMSVPFFSHLMACVFGANSLAKQEAVQVPCSSGEEITLRVGFCLNATEKQRRT